MSVSTIPSTDTATQSPFFGSARKKVFDFGRPVPLDRAQKQLCFSFCEQLQRFKLLSRASGAVFRSLLFDFHNSRSGLCFPSAEAIAAKALVSVRTVARSLILFERFGLLTWVHRLRRVVVNGVSVPTRSSNSYVFHVPASVEAACALASRFAEAAAAALSAPARLVRLVSRRIAAAALSSCASMAPAPPSVSQGALDLSSPPASVPDLPAYSSPVVVSAALAASLARVGRLFGGVSPPFSRR